MNNWSLNKLFSNLHNNIQNELLESRDSFGHSVAKGDASEFVWLNLFRKYLPLRYQTESGFVVDSNGKFSEQIDIIVFDRQYTPFIFQHAGKKIVPAEGVYAIFEVKQTISTRNIEYSAQKIKSVRELHRTSLPIPHAGGTYSSKESIPIIGGILSLESDWKPPLGQPLIDSLNNLPVGDHLDFGCIVSHGYFRFDKEDNNYESIYCKTSATVFLFKFLTQLQISGTVPMIDINAYLQWLSE